MWYAYKQGCAIKGGNKDFAPIKISNTEYPVARKPLVEE